MEIKIYQCSLWITLLLSIIPTCPSQHVQPSAGENWFSSIINPNQFRRLNQRNRQKKVRRREGSTWCEGTCTNLLLCSISGGETVKDHSCKGLFSVCCQTKPVQSSLTDPVLELIRVPRQLSPPSLS